MGRIAFIRFCIDIKTLFIVLIGSRFFFLESIAKFIVHKIKKGSAESIAKESIIKMLPVTPDAAVAKTTFGDKTMDVTAIS